MNIREGFIKALEENEDDISTRMVYSDWLDENGEYEEADRMRKWQAAKQWLSDFACKYGETCINYSLNQPYDEYQETSFKDIVKIGIDYVDSEGEDYFVQVGREGLRNNFSQEYWKNWSIITGRPIPKIDGYGDNPFSCSC